MQGGVCFTNQQDAIDTHFDGIAPTLHHNETTNALTSISYQRDNAGNWFLIKKTYDASGVVSNNYTSALSVPYQATCSDPNDKTTLFLEGMELGWAVAGVMVVAFCLRFLRRR